MTKIKRFTKDANIEFASIIDGLLKEIKSLGYKRAFSKKIKNEIKEVQAKRQIKKTINIQN